MGASLKFGKTGESWKQAPTAILLGLAASVALFGALVAFIRLLVTIESPESRGALVAMFGAVVFFLAFAAGAFIELWRVIRRANHAREECDRQIALLQQQLTERGKALEKAVRETERAAKARTIFLASASESLLKPVERLIEQTRSFTPADPIQTAALMQIHFHSETLQKEIRLLLDASHIESGQLNLLIERGIKLDEILPPVIDGARRTLQVNPNVQLHLEVEDGLRVTADRQRLSQMLELLLSNSIRYTEAGRITLKIQDAEDLVQITVSDTGASLSPENLQRAFDGLRRTSPWKLEDNALDLSLPIVKALTLAHRGHVWAENGHEAGVAYNIAIPK